MKDMEPTAFNIAEARDIAKQIEVELAILLSIEQSLRIALQWMTRGRGNGRKLATLRFVARSFEQQLQRTRLLEENGGYLPLVFDSKPGLAEEMKALQHRREETQAEFERIIMRLEYISADDAEGFAQICTSLETYLSDLNVHNRKELELLQRSLYKKEDRSAPDTGPASDETAE
jgi:hypothetical protein